MRNTKNIPAVLEVDNGGGVFRIRFRCYWVMDALVYVAKRKTVVSSFLPNTDLEALLGVGNAMEVFNAPLEILLEMHERW